MSIISAETIKAIGGMVPPPRGPVDIQDEAADALGADVEYRLREIIQVGTVCWWVSDISKGSYEVYEARQTVSAFL